MEPPALVVRPSSRRPATVANDLPERGSEMRGYIGVSNHGPYLGVVKSFPIDRSGHGRGTSRTSRGPAYNPNAVTRYGPPDTSARRFNHVASLVLVTVVALLALVGALVGNDTQARADAIRQQQITQQQAAVQAGHDFAARNLAGLHEYTR
jgi:hypothetical protein